MQINTLTLLLSLGAILLPPAFAQSEYQPQQVQYQGLGDAMPAQGTFKCFIDTNVGEGIYAFTWGVADTVKNMRTLPGSPLNNSAMAAKGIQVYAGKVYECVPDESEFSLGRARELDASRAR
ncbi:TapY2 family type IVa secretion system protein [Shewanella sp. JM162201]|uniref:TapY2 family type IVa secretion system protein n=1 Tax=Shewanella jiangmenensis TaxID=2837387 RepID=A0ABS5V0T0_9GAMM|nr:TapY2 family type IVa secretion system protein [Shewanella jiangmenensis]MBT1443402.1 TapY2 family type IVa secretion system protein [Shewanella jiangmenensis]